ncbi:hydrogenase maturation protease [Streptomyces meridianus]|uniref:Hydrogenase maturation protease n=1 Tax=Streptomyces meridianus TaxID=2938945 RepID=A0ABT0X558_9ACTN|nr:hydrogenase maturation protease [Streptomyces meridianus]MCM2577676.1 hydrogenase maturation protease [Streptomyces meridianus]
MNPTDVSGNAHGRTLVAGIGNIFLGDDGFGVEAVRRLARQPRPDDVDVVDTGVRGVHLAYQVLDGYRRLVLLDATARGGEPGTVYRIEDPRPAPDGPGEALIDGHRMTPGAVLSLLDALSTGTGGSRPEQVFVVGCEPACLDEGIGLSEPVEAAVDEAVGVVLEILRNGRQQDGPAQQAAGHAARNR